MSAPDHSHAQWSIPAHVVFQVLDGQAVVLDLDSGKYFGLNEVGTILWQGLEHGQSLEQITESLMESYEVDRVELQRDLAELVSTLKQRRLLEDRSELSA